MKSRRRFLVLLVTVVLLAIALPSLAQSRPTPPPDYYPLPINAWWKYQSTTSAGQKSEFKFEVVKTEKQPDGTTWIQTAVTSGSQFFTWYSKPKGWVLEHKLVYPQTNREGVYQPVKKFIQNPMAKGASWSWQGTGIMDVAIEESSTVFGPEQVVVPAGKFSAMKVVTDVSQGGAKMKRTQWFANYVGMVKSETASDSFQSTSELLDYSFRKKP
uniref:DUF3108 domain-containing protein n=1 Tax=Cyanothece sp. (strain PCC 7425 / ATCC 29141) TaxID=395961 RepID=B8HM60_CYAP4